MYPQPLSVVVEGMFTYELPDGERKPLPGALIVCPTRPWISSRDKEWAILGWARNLTEEGAFAAPLTCTDYPGQSFEYVVELISPIRSFVWSGVHVPTPNRPATGEPLNLKELLKRATLSQP